MVLPVSPMEHLANSAKAFIRMPKIIFKTLVLLGLTHGTSAFFASNKAAWSFTPDVCLPMSDPTYPNNITGTITQEEIVLSRFPYLFCLYDCCGDSRNPTCCDRPEEVGTEEFETYKIAAIIAAAVVGLGVAGGVVLYLMKKSAKKQRMIRDIQAVNRSNDKADMKRDKGALKYGESKNNKKKGKFFKSKEKKPSVIKVKSAGDESDRKRSLPSPSIDEGYPPSYREATELDLTVMDMPGNDGNFEPKYGLANSNVPPNGYYQDPYTNSPV